MAASSSSSARAAWRDDPSSRAAMRFGWAAASAFLFFGIGLELLHFVKAPFYVDVHMRREMWTLAHAHGVLIALFTIVYAAIAPGVVPRATARVRASWLLRIGALLVPVGFLAGGVGSAEGDPSLGIVLVPIGATLVLLAFLLVAQAVWMEKS
ncbi:MAG: hypothetical protein AAF772_14770 [Acidobacteriota bacterium]